MSEFARERYARNFGGRKVTPRELPTIAKAAAAEALLLIGHDLQGRAQREAPLDEGTLRGSASTTVVSTAHGVEVIVAFDTPYAAVQHEGVSFNHPKAGKAKYLEDPLKEMAPRYAATLAAALRRKLG